MRTPTRSYPRSARGATRARSAPRDLEEVHGDRQPLLAQRMRDGLPAEYRRASAAPHGLREHRRARPAMRSVGRLGGIVAGQQRVAVDVSLQIRDLPERDHLTADVERGEHRGKSRHHALFSCHPREAMLCSARMEDMVRQTDQIINFTNEINRRIAEAGITGVDGLVGLYDQLRSALGKVSHQELEWAQGEVNRVLERLRRLSEELSHLAALKAALETGH